MSWFEDLFGFPETSPDQVRENLRHEDGVIYSAANGAAFRCGRLETPTLAKLRMEAKQLLKANRPTSVSEVVADVQELHLQRSNTNALFQVASQFNLLEMTGPSVTPEQGISGYEYDRTQGPACAIACGAATAFRNYFVEVDGQIGQSANRQIDCLTHIGELLGNVDGRLWVMRNGYALPTHEGLKQIVAQLAEPNPLSPGRLRRRLRIGIQSGAEVTLDHHTRDSTTKATIVNQAFCSALPVAYSRLSADLWEPFARLVLEAAYEATLLAGVLNYERTGCPRVYLTLLGGGAFGNRREWIVDAIERAIICVEGRGLSIHIVSYGRRTPELRRLLT